MHGSKGLKKQVCRNVCIILLTMNQELNISRRVRTKCFIELKANSLGKELNNSFVNDASFRKDIVVMKKKETHQTLTAQNENKNTHEKNKTKLL